MSKIEELLEVIKADPNYQYYQELEARVNSSHKIKTLVQEIKSIQQELVLAKELDKKNVIISIENRYQEKLDELEKIPQMLDYLDLQNYYNNLIQTIRVLIETTIEEILND